jgi:hypothetical protein
VSAIVLQPRNGSARIDDAHSVIYTPYAQFTGSDRFIQRICGRRGDLQGENCSNIEYAVTVY